jgi:hypothetical protein
VTFFRRHEPEGFTVGLLIFGRYWIATFHTSRRSA